MIGIKAISTCLPAGYVDNLQRAEALGSTPKQVIDRIGFTSVARINSKENTTTIAHQALTKLFAAEGLIRDEIDVLVVVSQNQDRNIPHLSAELHGLMGLSKHCACFDIGLGCSGYVYALSIIQAFMQANQLEKGVLVTADPYSKIVDQYDKNTALIFGDGATATLLDDSPVYTIGKTQFGTYGAEADKLSCNDGTLFMNGRAVFNFTATEVPNNIKTTLAVNGLETKDIDYFFLHQGSKFIVETIANRLGVGLERVPFWSSRYGNTVSSSIPMMLSEVLNDSEYSPQQFGKLVLSGFGLGLSWASTVIQYKG